MPNDMQKRAREIFCACLKLGTPSERLEVVRRESGGDPSLESDVLELLEAHEADDSFLERYSRLFSNRHWPFL